MSNSATSALHWPFTSPRTASGMVSCAIWRTHRSNSQRPVRDNNCRAHQGKGQGARGKGQGARGKGQGARGKGQGARGKESEWSMGMVCAVAICDYRTELPQHGVSTVQLSISLHIRCGAAVNRRRIIPTAELRVEIQQEETEEGYCMLKAVWRQRRQ